MSDPILNPDTETADLRVADSVRDLAEDIAGEVVGCGTTMTERFGPDWIEARIHAFLAEQEEEQAGALAALRGALVRVAGGCGGERGIKGRCQACARHDVHQASCIVGKALASGSGSKEAEVIRAAVEERRTYHLMRRDGAGRDERIAWQVASDKLTSAVDRLSGFARGGEG